MELSSIALMYFSPTGSTKKILLKIAEGTGIRDIKYYDLTLSKDRSSFDAISEDLLIIGMPVYYQELPETVVPTLKQLVGNRTSVFLVAVYGSVTEGYTLKQLESLLEKRDFIVIGGASFVAEHSFSHEKFPIAQGRPDSRDLEIAYSLGSRIVQRLKKTTEGQPLLKPNFPNNQVSLHKGLARFIAKQPVFDPELCIRCQTCVEACPTDGRER